MTHAQEVTLPRYLKDKHGYCYVATRILAKKGTLEPWDGAVDANGFAVDEAAAAPTTSKRSRSRAPRPAEQQPDALDSALDALRDQE